MLHTLVWLSDTALDLGSSSCEEVQWSEIVSEYVLAYVPENGLVVDHNGSSPHQSHRLSFLPEPQTILCIHETVVDSGFYEDCVGRHSLVLF